MKKTEIKIVVTFDTIADAMAMERICKEQNIKGRLIPTPHSLSAGCGISWCSDKKYQEKIHSIVDNVTIGQEQIEGVVVEIIL